MKFKKAGRVKWKELEAFGYFNDDGDRWILSLVPHPFAFVTESGELKFKNYNGGPRLNQKVWISNIHDTKIIPYSGMHKISKLQKIWCLRQKPLVRRYSI